VQPRRLFLMRFFFVWDDLGPRKEFSLFFFFFLSGRIFLRNFFFVPQLFFPFAILRAPGPRGIQAGLFFFLAPSSPWSNGAPDRGSSRPRRRSSFSFQYAPFPLVFYGKVVSPFFSVFFFPGRGGLGAPSCNRWGNLSPLFLSCPLSVSPFPGRDAHIWGGQVRFFFFALRFPLPHGRKRGFSLIGPPSFP